jgi:hypothetical protein
MENEDNEEMPPHPETPDEIMDEGERRLIEAAARFTSQYTVLRRTFLAMKESFDREKAAIYDFSTNGRIPKNGKFFSFTLLNKQSNSTFTAIQGILFIPPF